jgi:hypothetical protein
MFFFYNNLDDLKIKDLKLKENYKYTIFHPFATYDEGKQISEILNIEVTLEICTVYKGTPYGLAIIKYSHPNNDGLSFKGVGIFNQGKLTNSSFTFIRGNGFGHSFTKMENGRPVDNSYVTYFNPKGCKKNVFSTKKEIVVSGW